MVDDDFVAAVRTQRCLNSLGDGLTGLDIADNGTIFGIVAVKFSIISLLILIGSFSTSYDFFFGSVLLSSGGGIVWLRLPLIARFEKTPLGGSRHRQRHSVWKIPFRLSKRNQKENRGKKVGSLVAGTPEAVLREFLAELRDVRVCSVCTRRG